MSGYLIYFLGVLTPFVVLVIGAFISVLIDRIKERWREGHVVVAAHVRCPVWGCDWTANSWIKRGRKRSARQMLREHIELEHEEGEA